MHTTTLEADENSQVDRQPLGVCDNQTRHNCVNYGQKRPDECFSNYWTLWTAFVLLFKQLFLTWRPAVATTVVARQQLHLFDDGACQLFHVLVDGTRFLVTRFSECLHKYCFLGVVQDGNPPAARMHDSFKQHACTIHYSIIEGKAKAFLWRHELRFHVWSIISLEMVSAVFCVRKKIWYFRFEINKTAFNKVCIDFLRRTGAGDEIEALLSGIVQQLDLTRQKVESHRLLTHLLKTIHNLNVDVFESRVEFVNEWMIEWMIEWMQERVVRLSGWWRGFHLWSCTSASATPSASFRRSSSTGNQCARNRAPCCLAAGANCSLSWTPAAVVQTRHKNILSVNFTKF